MNRLQKAVTNIARFSDRLGTLRGLLAYTRIAIFKRLPGAPDRTISLRVPQVGTPVYLRPKTTDVHAFWQVFIGGDYDFPVNGQPDFIVDAGAHVGFATLYLQHRFPQATIVAIEPEESNARMLAANTRDYSRVRLHRAALWNNHQKLRIENPGADSWSFRIQDSDSSAGNVAAITIPDILADTASIDILKLDIEGAEKELFSGDVGWLDKIGMVILEFHEHYAPGSTAMINDRLKEYGFTKVLEKGENVIFQSPRRAG